MRDSRFTVAIKLDRETLSVHSSDEAGSEARGEQEKWEKKKRGRGERGGRTGIAERTSQ